MATAWDSRVLDHEAEGRGEIESFSWTYRCPDNSQTHLATQVGKITMVFNSQMPKSQSSASHPLSTLRSSDFQHRFTPMEQKTQKTT